MASFRFKINSETVKGDKDSNVRIEFEGFGTRCTVKKLKDLTQPLR